MLRKRRYKNDRTDISYYFTVWIGNKIEVEVKLTSVIAPVRMVAKREIPVHAGNRIAIVQLVMTHITDISSLPVHAT